MPNNMAARMLSAAPGLRAMPSHADETMRPCPKAPPNAAMATPKPAAIISAVGLMGGFSAAPPACANDAGTTIKKARSTIRTTAVFFIISSSWINRQEVVPGHRAAGLTLKRPNEI